jgi:hypothetical protein
MKPARLTKPRVTFGVGSEGRHAATSR